MLAKLLVWDVLGSLLDESLCEVGNDAEDADQVVGL